MYSLLQTCTPRRWRPKTRDGSCQVHADDLERNGRETLTRARIQDPPDGARVAGPRVQCSFPLDDLSVNTDDGLEKKVFPL